MSNEGTEQSALPVRFFDAIPPGFARSASWIRHWLWATDLRLERRGLQGMLVAALALVAFVSEMYFHVGFSNIPAILTSTSAHIFYNVNDVALSTLAVPLAPLIVKLGIARIVFGAIIGLLDVALYERVTGRPFDWEGMIVIAVVNIVFLTTLLFTWLNPACIVLLHSYDNLVSRVPTIAHFNGVSALIIACLIGDFCFYWSHRWCHKVRFFWFLGHINHHRSRHLSQLTQAVDPHALFLDTAGGKSSYCFCCRY